MQSFSWISLPTKIFYQQNISRLLYGNNVNDEKLARLKFIEFGKLCYIAKLYLPKSVLRFLHAHLGDLAKFSSAK